MLCRKHCISLGLFVIPAKAGIQNPAQNVDSRFRGNDSGTDAKSLEAKLLPPKRLENLLQEANELIAMSVSSVVTAKGRLNDAQAH